MYISCNCYKFEGKMNAKYISLNIFFMNQFLLNYMPLNKDD
jgi:hypothetical protein